ncbi:MAG: P-II family nitrogen regulator [Deltaproteobacteria bacterium]|nr:P-II family nitrogen regulator [Deltaproteobacteria bacterium]
MKEVRAFIQPFKLSKVTHALQQIAGFPGMSVIEIQGFGRGKARCPGDKVVREFVPKVHLEIMVKDELVEEVVQAIEKAAHTGNPGDGAIFVLPVEQEVRIRTGERDREAIRSEKNGRTKED